MPRRRDERARVLGPTWCQEKEAWRITVVDPSRDGSGSGRNYRYFGGEKDQGQKDALKFKRIQEVRLVRLSGTTIEQALDEFRQYLPERGNKPASDTETMRRLGLFFKSVLKMQVARLRPERGAELYKAFREGRAVDYHRDALSAARWFMGWCVDRGWTAESPLAKVKGTGKKNKGKMQFTGDETKKWIAYCLAKASRRDTPSAVRDSDAAIALMMLLLLALRQSDVLRRTVRDVDMGATVLRVTNGKTKKSNRPRAIPSMLRLFLLAVTAGRGGEESLFGHHTISWLWGAQRRFCKAAGVPYVCPHGLKGTMGSTMAEHGESVERIAHYLSHENPYITEQHYILPGIIDGAQASRAIEYLYPVPIPVPDASGGIGYSDKN